MREQQLLIGKKIKATIEKLSVEDRCKKCAGFICKKNKSLLPHQSSAATGQPELPRQSSRLSASRAPELFV